MELSFYKPNRSGSGSAFAFKLVPDEKNKNPYKRGILGFLFTAILQARPLQGRGGEMDVFSENRDVEAANTVGKLSETEVAGMIRVIETTRFRPSAQSGQETYSPTLRLHMYHQFGNAKKSFDFYPFNLKGKDGERLAFSFTVNETQGEKKKTFKIALEVDEAWRLKFFLVNGLAAIDEQRLRRFMASRKEVQGAPAKNWTRSSAPATKPNREAPSPGADGVDVPMPIG